MNKPGDNLRKDRSGNPLDIRVCCPEDVACLLEMYHMFTPRPASQGLPPQDPETCECWARGLVEIGMNLLVWRDGKVIGHAAIVPDVDGESGEFVIFIHQEYRNLGIGTELTHVILENAKWNNYESVWLTVATTNFIAIRLYKNVGFEFSDMDAVERTMLIGLIGPNQKESINFGLREEN